MKTLLFSLIIALLSVTLAWAACRTYTEMRNGKMYFCQTCCDQNGQHCMTTCHS